MLARVQTNTCNGEKLININYSNKFHYSYFNTSKYECLLNTLLSGLIAGKGGLIT